MNKTLEALTGTTVERKKSRIPAKLDYIQSATGLFLALFMVGHMLLVSSILISKDFMYTIAKLLEGSFIFEGGEPFLVTIAAGAIFTIFIVHAGVALRKFPINYAQFMKYREHMKLLNHEDTTLWFWQVVTGFAMFFMGSVHLYIMMSQPDTIGPYGSADRMVSDWMWPLYLFLLIAVEFHGSIGLYRLAVKWGWFDGDNPKATRAKLKKFKWYNTIFLLTLGILTLIAYVRIGIEHKPNYGEKYKPQSSYNIQLSKARLS